MPAPPAPVPAPSPPWSSFSPYSAEDERGAFDWWIASDPSEVARGGAVLPAGHVLGIGGASRTLAQLTIRRPVERVLDLGTGCGIQALHAARHTRVVVATDVDERALAFTRFNAALNLSPSDGVVETRLGSMLEPVAGERFDLVVSNPPFVITPREAGMTEYTYRDGGASGDDLVRDLVGSLGSVLTPGGVAQLLGELGAPRGAALGRAGRLVAGPAGAGRLGGPARGAGPGRVRGALAARRRPDPRARPGRLRDRLPGVARRPRLT
ncbi:methyltransferase [Salana multivorans]